MTEDFKFATTNGAKTYDRYLSDFYLSQGYCKGFEEAFKCVGQFLLDMDSRSDKRDKIRAGLRRAKGAIFASMLCGSYTRDWAISHTALPPVEGFSEAAHVDNLNKNLKDYCQMSVLIRQCLDEIEHRTVLTQRQALRGFRQNQYSVCVQSPDEARKFLTLVQRKTKLGWRGEDTKPAEFVPNLYYPMCCISVQGSELIYSDVATAARCTDVLSYPDYSIIQRKRRKEV